MTLALIKLGGSIATDEDAAADGLELTQDDLSAIDAAFPESGGGLPVL